MNTPLRIDAVRLSCSGEIGMTLCPGKRQTGALSGDWHRDLTGDIRAIREWGAVAVLTVMESRESRELRELGVPEIGEAVEKAGMDWHHLPIPDGGIPDANFENLWLYSGHRVRAGLMAGKRILIHCKGGLGRTGMIAARLLVELGETPADATRRVRKARLGTIENAQQERHVGKCAPLSLEPKLLDRMLGCLLGGAVGDALGYEVEFDRWPKIEATFGSGGISQPIPRNGKIRVSDDTQMTLFTLEGIDRSKAAIERNDTDALVENIRLAYLDWLYTQGEQRDGRNPVGNIAADPRLRHRMAPGNTCLAALRAGGSGMPAKPINDSKGCGGVMRVAPLGLVPKWQPTEAAEVAARAAALTHGHPSGYLSAAALAAMVRFALDGINLEDAASRSREIVSGWKGAQETTDGISAALEAAQRQDGDPRANVSRLGEGSVGEEALSIGLYSALTGRSFPEVLSIAANHSGDSDSTASIAGQLYGAWKGLADLPNEWILKLDVLDILLGLLRQAIV